MAAVTFQFNYKSQPGVAFNINPYFLSAKTAFNADENTESITLKINAHQNPSTLIPSSNLSANKIMSALITKRKRPKVTTVIGNVSKTNIGFTIAFKQAKTKAKIMAVVISDMCTPDNILASTYAMMPEINRRRIKFMFICLDVRRLNKFAKIKPHFIYTNQLI